MSWPCKQLTVKTQDAELRAWSNDLATKTLQTGILLNTSWFYLAPHVVMMSRNILEQMMKLQQDFKMQMKKQEQVANVNHINHNLTNHINQPQQPISTISTIIAISSTRTYQHSRHYHIVKLVNHWQSSFACLSSLFIPIVTIFGQQNWILSEI